MVLELVEAVSICSTAEQEHETSAEVADSRTGTQNKAEHSTKQGKTWADGSGFLTKKTIQRQQKNKEENTGRSGFLTENKGRQASDSRKQGKGWLCILWMKNQSSNDRK